MKPFVYHFSIYPSAVNQVWGVYNPTVYSQFGYTRHNGKDRAMGIDKLVRAPFAGTIIRTGNQPTGGGIFCGLLSDDIFDFPDFVCKTPDNVSISFHAAQAKVLIDFLHLESFSITEGQHLNVGDIIAIQDNTGFSTGPHTHEQYRRVNLFPADVNIEPTYRVLGDQVLRDIDTNDANNSFDPTQFEDGKYAKDIKDEVVLIQNANTIFNEISVAPIPDKQRSSLLQALYNVVKAIQNYLFK